MKIKKLMLIAAAVCMMIVGAGGCMKKNSSVVDQMIAHMEEKYGDQFTFDYVTGGGVDKKGIEIICISETYPEEQVWVKYTKEDNGDIRIVDNYMGVKYKEETAQLFENLMKDVFDVDVRIIYAVKRNAVTEGASKDMTLEEYIGTASSCIGVTVIVDSSYEVNASDVEKQLEAAIREKGLCCKNGTIYFDGGRGMFDTVEESSLSKYCSHKAYDACFTFTMSDVYGFATSKWR